MKRAAPSTTSRAKARRTPNAPAPPTRAERYAAGKALRDKVPRKSHAGWEPPRGRFDPVEVLVESSAGRRRELVPIRYGRMLQSPFTFFRGAAAIMAADLAKTPKTGIRVQACGDCHLLNFGGFATPERRMIFDMNDFDETAPAPWEWDIKRLAASFVIAGRSNRFTRRECRAAAEASVRAYREHMAEYAEWPVLQTWYTSVFGFIESMKDSQMRKLYTQLLKKAQQRDPSNEFAKLTHLDGGEVRIKDDPPLIYHLDEREFPGLPQLARRILVRYRESLPEDRRVLYDRFRFTDMALKVVGVGSVGTLCAIVLFIAAEDDPLFLQVKEAHPSVLEPYAGKSVYENHGQRVVVGQRLMQAASDIFLGWTHGDLGRHYYVRQLRDVKLKPIIEMMKPQNLVGYAELCGWALARAHARSGDAALLTGYLGKSNAFDAAVADFAVAYADQNERDHAALVAATRSGRIAVQTDA